MTDPFDALFGMRRRNLFSTQNDHSGVPQEGLIASGNIAPQGFIAGGVVSANEIVVGGMGGGVNMLLNSSFERGFSNWGLSGTPPVNYLVGAGSTPDGSFCARFNAGGYQYALQTLLGPFLAGHWYTASVWVYGVTSTSSGGAGIVFESNAAVSGSIMTSAGPLSGTTVWVFMTGATTTWTRLWITWQQSADNASPYILLTNSYGGTSTGTYLMDAVQVEEGAIPSGWSARPIIDAAGSVRPDQMSGNPNNEIPNPGFEQFGGEVNAYGTIGVNTTLPGWTPSNGSANMGIFTTAGTDLRSGANGLVYKKVANGDDVYLETMPVPATQGRKYTVSVWVKGYAGNNAATTANVFVRGLDAARVSVGFHTLSPSPSTVIGANTTWQKISATFTVGSTTVYMTVGLELTGAGAVPGLLAWDDIELYPSDYDVNHAAGTVVINSSGVAITNGALTVTNASSTVIIDGTSNMFKIVATGTSSVVGAANDSVTATDTTLTGLGSAYTVCPAINNLVSTQSTLGFIHNATYLGLERDFVALTSGGAVTRKKLVVTDSTTFAAFLDASPGHVVVRLNVDNMAGAAIDRYGRYYVFVEAAI